jgi:hypothetical protein
MATASWTHETANVAVDATAPTKPARNVGRPVVYVLGTEDGTEVKIGYSKGDPRSRKAAHENENGHHRPLEWLAIVRAVQPSDETAIHTFFAQYASRPRSDEWFHAAPPVREWIRSLQGQPYVTRMPSDISSLEAVDPSYWLPDSMMSQAVAQQLSLDAVDDPWSDLKPDVRMEGDYYTDRQITEAARRAMGGIDLDPASCTYANRETVRARAFYGYRDNGLLQDWYGRVWLNPPFHQWESWGPKVEIEVRSGRVDQLCVLASTRSATTKGIQPIARLSCGIWVPDRRWPFWGPNAGAPDEGHIVYYIGSAKNAFACTFGALGGEVFTKTGGAA